MEEPFRLVRLTIHPVPTVEPLVGPSGCSDSDGHIVHAEFGGHLLEVEVGRLLVAHGLTVVQ